MRYIRVLSKLDDWLGNQKRAFKKGNMPAAHQKKFEVISGWEWYVTALQWERKVAYLKEYVDEFAKISTAKERYHDCMLGEWAQKQRLFYKKGTLSAEQIQILETIPLWYWSFKETLWLKSYTALSDYCEKQKRLPLYATLHNGVAISNWCYRQRTQYAAGKKSSDHIARLENLKWWRW